MYCVHVNLILAKQKCTWKQVQLFTWNCSCSCSCSCSSCLFVFFLTYLLLISFPCLFVLVGNLLAPFPAFGCLLLISFLCLFVLFGKLLAPFPAFSCLLLISFLSLFVLFGKLLALFSAFGCLLLISLLRFSSQLSKQVSLFFFRLVVCFASCSSEAGLAVCERLVCLFLCLLRSSRLGTGPCL